MDERVDDSARKAWYGSGRQPFDIIVEETPWAVGFCAANVLKYLRRPSKQSISDEWLSTWIAHETRERARSHAIDVTKEHSIESARWYYRRLIAWDSYPGHALRSEALSAIALLHRLLTIEELKLLAG